MSMGVAQLLDLDVLQVDRKHLLHRLQGNDHFAQMNGMTIAHFPKVATLHPSVIENSLGLNKMYIATVILLLLLPLSDRYHG